MKFSHFMTCPLVTTSRYLFHVVDDLFTTVEDIDCIRRIWENVQNKWFNFRKYILAYVIIWKQIITVKTTFMGPMSRFTALICTHLGFPNAYPFLNTTRIFDMNWIMECKARVDLHRIHVLLWQFTLNCRWNWVGIIRLYSHGQDMLLDWLVCIQMKRSVLLASYMTVYMVVSLTGSSKARNWYIVNKSSEKLRQGICGSGMAQEHRVQEEHHQECAWAHGKGNSWDDEY